MTMSLLVPAIDYLIKNKVLKKIHINDRNIFIMYKDSIAGDDFIHSLLFALKDNGINHDTVIKNSNQFEGYKVFHMELKED